MAAVNADGALAADGGEEFYDVPDAIENIEVSSREGDCEATLQWSAPCDNAREVTHYQVYVELWHMGRPCGPLPAQHKDDLDQSNAEESELRRVQAADVSTGGASLCRFRLRAPDFARGTEPDSARRLAMAKQRRLPKAVWVTLRACNSEGRAEWAAPLLVFFRGEPLAPAGAMLFSWGVSEDGRLGLGEEVVSEGVSAEVRAVKVFEKERFAALSLGAHTAAITAEDKLYVWGTFLAEDASCKASGEEGEDPDVVQVPTEPAFQPTPFVSHNVSCGRFATAVLTADARLYAWGPNEAHQCGVKELRVVRSLTQLRVPSRTPIVRVSMGELHGIALTAYGVALTWGLEQGTEIVLGAGNDIKPSMCNLPERSAMNQQEPRAVDISGSVIDVAAGGYHNAAITEDGRLWTWGNNDRQQLGHDLDVPSIFEPRVLSAFPGGEGTRIASVSLGGFHGAAIDEAGILHTWGDNKRGQCGQGDIIRVRRPSPVQFKHSSGLHCRSVSCGGFFTFVSASPEGSDEIAPRFYACGLGKEGCLGFGQPCKRMLTPQPIPPSQIGSQWAHVEAGVAHVVGLSLHE
eukprot:TRINITY_DN56627_c0_g1_i1.p1 TRINITY_DN56627_c0_g1~~TRINITY_DN56627_c0_g1_i1.p1  ORF type:complete len:592 (-),score=80.56 TRINITY_DN56627_c0_g1_i1:159-1886(-)